MRMREVKYFLAVCDELNCSRAEKRCGVSQLSLSEAIKGVEQKLGGPLFIRETMRVSLAELGRQSRRMG